MAFKSAVRTFTMWAGGSQCADPSQLMPRAQTELARRAMAETAVNRILGCAERWACVCPKWCKIGENMSERKEPV